MGDNRHTQNIQINEVIGENKKCIFYFMEKNHMEFLASPINAYTGNQVMLELYKWKISEDKKVLKIIYFISYI